MTDKLPLFFAKSKGVDRLLRFLQYSSKVVDILGITKRFLKMSAQLSIARKFLRIGAPLALILRVIRRVQGEALTLLKSCETLAEIALILYFFSDHMLLLHKLGLYKFSSLDPIEFLGNWSSLIDSVLSLLVSTVDLLRGNTTLEAWLDLLSTLMDMPVTCT